VQAIWYAGAWPQVLLLMRAMPDPHKLLNSRREDTELLFDAAVG